MEFIEALGIVGVLCILTAYAMNYAKKVKRDSRLYDGLNAVGSAFLVHYAVAGQVWAFVILNSVWFVLAIYHLLRRDFFFRHAKKAKKR